MSDSIKICELTKVQNKKQRRTQKWQRLEPLGEYTHTHTHTNSFREIKKGEKAFINDIKNKINDRL